jgi:hypothetical protein
MEANDNQDASKRKQSAFTIMNNVRDHCKQSDAKKVLMYSIALYANADGKCWPGNRVLANAINKSQRTVKRMLKELAADGELEILTPGGGHQKRVICLTRYVAIAPEMPIGGGDTQDVTGGVTPLHRQTLHNNHREQPVPKKNTFKVRYTHGAQTTSKNGEVFEGKEKGSHGKNGLQDNSGILRPEKRGAKIPSGQRNKIINRLNERKVAICRDASLTPGERERELDKLNQTLQKL